MKNNNKFLMAWVIAACMISHQAFAVEISVQNNSNEVLEFQLYQNNGWFWDSAVGGKFSLASGQAAPINVSIEQLAYNEIYFDVHGEDAWTNGNMTLSCSIDDSVDEIQLVIEDTKYTADMSSCGGFISLDLTLRWEGCVMQKPLVSKSLHQKC